MTLLLADLERTKLAATQRPRATRTSSHRSRHIPAAVRRKVWARDGGHCAFVGTNGRCAERGFLEFHHVAPYAAGGRTTVENLELRCRSHNAYEAEQYFGPLLLRRRVRRGVVQLGPALLCQIPVDPRFFAGRGASAAGAAPRAGKALPARTLSLARRLRVRVDDMC